jgi:hypothetical protein
MSGPRINVAVPILLLSVGVSWFLWDRSPDYIRQGGYLLIVGLACLFLVFTFGIERMLVLWRAGGRADSRRFLSAVDATVPEGDLNEALDACRKQGGSLANVAGADCSDFARSARWAEGGASSSPGRAQAMARASALSAASRAQPDRALPRSRRSPRCSVCSAPPWG